MDEGGRTVVGWYKAVILFLVIAILVIALMAIKKDERHGHAKSQTTDRATNLELLPDSLAFRPITPAEVDSLVLDSTDVKLGLNFSYERALTDTNVALVTRVIFAAEFSYETMLKLDSLGFMTDDQSIYAITRQALVRGADSTEVVRTLETEPIVWHQSLPPEVSNYCAVPLADQ